MSYSIDFDRKDNTITVHLYDSFGKSAIPVSIRGGQLVSKTEADIIKILKEVEKFLKTCTKEKISTQIK